MHRLIRGFFIGAVAALGIGAGGSTAWAGAPVAIYSFQGGADGTDPRGAVVADAAGNLFGVTEAGGVSNFGTVFELSPPASQSGFWTHSVLYTFTGSADGGLPEAGLVFDSGGNLYGTTLLGGYVPNCGGFGCGTVFKLAPPSSRAAPWIFTTIHTFEPKSVAPDGANPEAPVILDASGNLYGTTYAGGLQVNCCGTVFKLTPPLSGTGPWTETLLHAFSGYSEAAYPVAGVTFDKSGNLYGTTKQGGFFGKCCGVVYELSPPTGGSGPWTEAVVHRFMGPDGTFPIAGVVLDPAGNLFGVAQFGSGNASICNSGCGAAFELPAPIGGPPEQTIYRFGASSSGLPSAVVLQNGSLYGVAQGGSQGTLFSLSPSGKKFWNNVTVALAGNAGALPLSLALDPPLSGSTTFYGVAFHAGASGFGTIFSWTP